VSDSVNWGHDIAIVAIAWSLSVLSSWVLQRHDLHGERADRVCRLVEFLETKGADYWLGGRAGADCRRAAAEISGLSKQLGSAVDLYNRKKFLGKFSRYDLITAFRQSIMDGNFYDSCEDPSCNRPDRIHTAAADLLSAFRASV